jgi:hypothetical protein
MDEMVNEVVEEVVPAVVEDTAEQVAKHLTPADFAKGGAAVAIVGCAVYGAIKLGAKAVPAIKKGAQKVGAAMKCLFGKKPAEDNDPDMPESIDEEAKPNKKK